MSYDSESARLGKEPFITCTLKMDYCSLVAGVGACTATETGDAKCFNTRATCNDSVNFTKTTKEYKFCQPRSSIPKGVNMFPVIKGNIQKSSTSITAGAGLGKRAVVKIDLNDFAHHDRGIDPYVDERSYDPYERGTFWGKFLTRNPYYEGREITIDYGYIGIPFSVDDFESQTFDIVDMSGVNNSFITVTAKDVLVRTYEQKAQYPPANTGELLSDITDIATTATLSPTGIGNSEYPASGTLVIGKEVISFTRSGDILTFTAREQWGTTKKEHGAGDTVQLCITWDSISIIDVLDELLVTGSNLPSSYIPTADWIYERDLWMINSNVKGILIKPEPVNKIIAELSECFMFDLWWDGITSSVNLKALSPDPVGQSINTLNEEQHIVKGSVKIERNSKNRFTEVRVYYNKIDFSEPNKIEQFASTRISADASRAGSNRYNGNSIKTIMCRWFDLSSSAVFLAGRLLARFSDTPEIITFKLSQKDYNKVSMAERLSIDSWQFQDATGNNDTRTYQVIEIDEGANSGHDFTVKAFSSSFSGRYLFIAANDAPDFSSATETQKENIGFICQNDGLMPDGSDGYKII